MQLLTIDFETYYSKKDKYSLSAMPTDAYVLDPRFEVIGVSIKRNDGVPIWMSGTHEQVANWLAGFDWDNSTAIAHNALFDGFILTQVFGIKPKMWMDTLAMARAAFPWLASHSLANVAATMGLGVKGTEVHNADGLRRSDFTDNQLAAYGVYCGNDTQLCYDIAIGLMPQIPLMERFLIDMTVRMFTEPQFVGDVDAMQQMYEGEIARKEALLALAVVDRETIMSNDKFAAKLRSLGVEPPTKVSATTKRVTYAFAKTDKDFSALLEHPDSEVQALVSARLGVKTTIAETRALRFVQMAKRGPLPVYLNYWGAKTTGRFSGGNGTNWQNLSARGPSAGLRNAIKAPKGRKVVVGDSSNIELRVAMMLAGQMDVVEMIRDGVDLYCEFASKIYGRKITKADKIERMLGKIAMLSLQYGAGPERFMEMVRIQMSQAGIASPVDLYQAQNIVYLYRDTYSLIPMLWKYTENVVLPAIYNNDPLIPCDKQGWTLTMNGGFAVPGTPGVKYHNLRKSPDGGWEYTMGKMAVNLYGGKVVENMSQYVARMIVMWQTGRIHLRYPVALSVHDEAVTLPLETEVDACMAYMTECLSMAPQWVSGIPLASEVAVGDSYGEAK